MQACQRDQPGVWYTQGARPEPPEAAIGFSGGRHTIYSNSCRSSLARQIAQLRAALQSPTLGAALQFPTLAFFVRTSSSLFANQYMAMRKQAYECIFKEIMKYYQRSTSGHVQHFKCNARICSLNYTVGSYLFFTP